MINYEDVLLELVKPMCDDKSNVSVKRMETLNENEVLLYVYAPGNDIARLIGKQGSMASSIRTMMQAASSKGQRIVIKFEAL